MKIKLSASVLILMT